jgi:hypothetical protein
MKYVTVIGTGGKILAVGMLISYYGKWMRVRRNDNEEIAVNTDFVQAIHFMNMPTQKMIESMTRSVPTVDEEDEPRPPIAVKHTSGKIPQAGIEEIVQSLVDSGPPEMNRESTGAGLFSLPRTARLPDGVELDGAIVPSRPKRGGGRRRNDSK